MQIQMETESKTSAQRSQRGTLSELVAALPEPPKVKLLTCVTARQVQSRKKPAANWTGAALRVYAVHFHRRRGGDANDDAVAVRDTFDALHATVIDETRWFINEHLLVDPGTAFAAQRGTMLLSELSSLATYFTEVDLPKYDTVCSAIQELMSTIASTRAGAYQ